MFDRVWLGVACVALLLSTLSGCQAAGGADREGGRFHVVECGHSSPDTLYYARNLKDLERRGHNGTSLYVMWPREKAGNLGMGSLNDCLNWRTWTNVRITDEMIADAIADLRGAQSGHFTSNMIPIFTHPRETSRSMDWYNDEWWEAICHNARQIARVAREGRCLGIMLDMEEYGYRMWTYDGLQSGGLLKDKTYDQVKAQARKRGRAYARALCSAYPDITVWTFFAWCYEVKGAEEARREGKEPPQSLIGAFCDGMLEGSTEGFVLVDGRELSYGFTTREEFAAGSKLVRETALRYTEVPELYRKKVRVGHGLYVDASAYKGYYFNRSQPEKNYFTPGRLQRAIYWALREGDGYVWTWSEKPVWWVEGPRDTPAAPGKLANTNQTGIPPVYWEAVRNAFTSPGKDRSVPEPVKDPDPKVARYIRFERPGEEDDPFGGGEIPDRFVKIADLPTDGWLFRTDYLDQGEGLRWFDPATSTEGWRPIRIAEFYERQGVDYDGTAWYRREVTIPKLSEGKRIYLFFGAVDESLWCYINGELVAWNDGDGNDLWNRPFALDVTGKLPSGSTCTIVFRTLDRFRMGGIWRPVSIARDK